MTYDFLIMTVPCRKEWQNLNPPLGIASIGGMLESKGYTTKLVDGANLTLDQMDEIIKNTGAKVIGVSCTTTEQRHNVARVVDAAKRIKPDIPVIVGGLHFTIFPAHAFNMCDCDVVVLGEGEYTMVELGEVYIKKTRKLEDVKGIVFEEFEEGRPREPVMTEHRPFIENLDDIPFPKYDDFDMGSYFKDVMYREAVPSTKELVPGKISISRGCPFRCAFCSVNRNWGNTVRYKSTEYVIKEIKWLQEKYGVEWLFVQDDNLTFKNGYVIDLCKKIIENNIKITWLACSRVTVSKEALEWMKKAGCYAVMYGVESGSDEVLKKMKKGQTAQMVVDAFKRTNEAGLHPLGFLMVGNQGDSFKSMYQTYKLWKKIRSPDDLAGIGASIAWVFPNTEMYDVMVTKGIITDDYWLDDNQVPYFTAESSFFKLRMMRNFLYFLWAQHVLRSASWKMRLIYTKKIFLYVWNNIMYFFKAGEFKTY